MALCSEMARGSRRRHGRSGRPNIPHGGFPESLEETRLRVDTTKGLRAFPAVRVIVRRRRLDILRL
jgi:hypothetical protein